MSHTIKRSAAITSMCALVVCVAAGAVRATTYYVDNSPAGNDNANGTSTSTPWQSLTKVNNAGFGAGDRVLFRHGCVWSGQLAISSAGASGNPIYFGAYGDTTADKPAINCGGDRKATIFVRNGADNVTVEGFRVTNYDGADVFDGAEARRSGIQIGEWGGSVSNVLVTGNVLQQCFLSG